MTTPGDTHTALSIELCGKLADRAGALVEVDFPVQGCSAAELIALVAQQHPVLGLGRERVRACVNETVAEPAFRVMPCDDVALFPPVSGG